MAEESTCGCPDGFKPSGDGVTCIKITTVAATATGTVYDVAAGNQIANYGQSGANFYDDATARPLPITAQIAPNRLEDSSAATLGVFASVMNTLWGNGGSPLNGRLNQAGVWTTLPLGMPINEWIGFTACVDILEDGVYCIGLAADNRCRFKINGQVVVELDNGSTFCFTKWHVVPFTLTAGLNIIEMEGKNDGANAAFGAEIYKATTAQLMVMTTYAELAPVTVFSTVNQIGNQFQTGQSSGYTCPEGYSLNNCDGSYTCTLIEREPFVDCCFLLTNCQTGDILISDSDLLTYLGSSVVLTGYEGCWVVSESVSCISPISVIVSSVYPSCLECLPNCWMLIDCENLEPNIITNIDLTEYQGHTVQIKYCTGKCWHVAKADTCLNAREVIIVADFDTCMECLPKPEPEAAPILKHRKVMPGYDTPGCSPEYTEKINCAFSEQVFNIIKKMRYGISACCEEDLMRYSIKKDLLDLRAIYDPDGCVSTLVNCCAPCHVEVSVNVFTPISCPSPDSVVATMVITACGSVESASAEIVFNNPLGA